MFSRGFTRTGPFLHMFPQSMGAAASKLGPVMLSSGGGGLKLQQQQQQRRTVLMPLLRLSSTYQYQGSQRGEQLAEQSWKNPKLRIFVGVVIFGLGFYLYNLETVPLSGRRRFNFFSTEVVAQMARHAYPGVKESYQEKILSSYHPTTRYVKRVLDRLVPVSELGDLKWEVFVIEDNSITNAFVIPCGKIFVFSGILDICGDEDGLAVVLSHEIAHTVAHHTSERLSKAVLAIAGLFFLSVASGTDIWMLGNVVDVVYLRPGWRRQEAEADYIGLMMMAEACVSSSRSQPHSIKVAAIYDPSKAVGVWERMEEAQEFEPPQFLSTHPPNKTRISNIKEWLPEALQKFENSEYAGRTMMDYVLEFLKGFGYTNQ